jgi:signal transduction histidine kinase
MFETRAADDRIDLQIALADHLPCLRGDAARVREIVLNLLSNAVKYTPPGGRITMGARLDPDRQLEISIADSGIGISPDRLKVIQRPFHLYEVEDPLTRTRATKLDEVAAGHGLGLPLARLLTEMHGGHLTIESAPRSGTTVRVRFPLVRLEWPERQDVVGGVARRA